MDSSFIIGLEGLGVLVLLIAFRVPIAYSMLVVGIGGVAILSGPAIILSQLKDLAYAQFSSYGLSVVPMFILMGSLSHPCGIEPGPFPGCQYLAWQVSRRGSDGGNCSLCRVWLSVRIITRHSLYNGKGGIT